MCQGVGNVIQNLSSMHKTLSLVPNTIKNQQTKNQSARTSLGSLWISFNLYNFLKWVPFSVPSYTWRNWGLISDVPQVAQQEVGDRAVTDPPRLPHQSLTPDLLQGSLTELGDWKLSRQESDPRLLLPFPAQMTFQFDYLKRMIIMVLKCPPGLPR